MDRPCAKTLDLSSFQLDWVHNENAASTNNCGPVYRNRGGSIAVSDNIFNGTKKAVSNPLATALNGLISFLKGNPIHQSVFSSLITHGNATTKLQKDTVDALAPHWLEIIKCATIDENCFINKNDVKGFPTELGYPLLDMIEGLSNHKAASQPPVVDPTPGSVNVDLATHILFVHGNTQHNNILFRMTKILQDATKQR